MKEFPSRHYWCGKCELTTPIYGNEYVCCKICGSTDVVLKEKITDKLNFDADELFVKEFLNRLIKCVKPIAMLDKAKLDEILADMKKDSSKIEVPSAFKGMIDESKLESFVHCWKMQLKEWEQERTGFDFDKTYPRGIVHFMDENGFDYGWRNGANLCPMPATYDEWVHRCLGLGYKIRRTATLFIGQETEEGIISGFDIQVVENKNWAGKLKNRTKKIVVFIKGTNQRLSINEVHPKKSSEQQKYPEGVLSVLDNYKNVVSFSDGVMISGDILTYQQWMEKAMALSKTMGYKIHSVKNKHGEVLTVGQESNFGKIMCFKIVDNHIFVGADKLPGSNTKGMPGIGQHMDGVHLLSKGIVTHDGYAIKEHDGVWLLDLNDYGFSFYEDVLSVAKREKSLFFKHRENCERHVAENKPMFSKKQLLDALKIPEWQSPLDDGRVNTLRNFVIKVRDMLFLN